MVLFTPGDSSLSISIAQYLLTLLLFFLALLCLPGKLRRLEDFPTSPTSTAKQEFLYVHVDPSDLCISKPTVSCSAAYLWKNSQLWHKHLYDQPSDFPSATCISRSQTVFKMAAVCEPFLSYLLPQKVSYFHDFRSHRMFSSWLILSLQL